MNEIEALLEKYNKPLTHEEINKVIYNAFGIIIFLLPILPEIMGVGIYSLKYTLFNLTTIVTSIVLFALNIKNIKNVKLNVYDKMLCIYLLLVGLSTIFAKHGIEKAILGTNGRGEGLITIFSYIATFVIFSKGYKHITKTTKIALIGAVIVSIYAFIQAKLPIKYELLSMNGLKTGIAKGTTSNQNFLSSYICIFLPAMCYYYINSKKHSSLIVISLLFTTLVFTVTLGGYITFATMFVAVVIFSICFSKNKKQTLLRIGILTAVIVSVYYGITYQKSTNKVTTNQGTIIQEKPESIYTKEIASSKQEVTNLATGSDKFGSRRMEIWKRTIAAIRNNILFGTGPDSLYPEFRYGNYALSGNEDILNNYLVDKAHSEPLQIAVTTGLPSAIVYLFFVAILVIKLLVVTIKNIKENGINDKHTIFITVMLVSILSYLMQSMINISVIQVAPVFWAMLGIGAGITLDENTNK